MPLLPVTLLGDNLGQRHHYLNSKVNQTATGLLFEDIEVLPEQSAVDRLFKIDVANKLNNVDYILKNIRDDDLLYVSRALKCSWLIDQRDVINPKYLEEVLFPQMIMPAISKMKHWLYINLTDPLICREFYQYYKSKEFQLALKFLRRCENEFLLNEFPEILIQVTPHYLKVLGEKCPKLVIMYFDTLTTNNELTKRYLKNEKAFYDSTKCLLKSYPDRFLDITEKYHKSRGLKKFNPSVTKYILRHHKSRFLAKSELYVVHLLHMPTVARELNGEECQDLIIKLARAEYLNWWFSYSNVEFLIKRVRRGDREALKKRVFVDKDVGERVLEWPYSQPDSPFVPDTSSEAQHVFRDQVFEPVPMSWNGMRYYKHSMLRHRRIICKKTRDLANKMRSPSTSELQKLFDEFRIVEFDATLNELIGRLSATTSADRRRDFLLVLVSKSSGRSHCIRALMTLALKLRNEPVHERAAVIRSLVKRASAWRLPDDVWDMVLEYSQGLGLDGGKPECRCKEGLHAVVIRQFLESGQCKPALRNAFLDNFSTFAEYKLMSSERSTIAACLQTFLITTAAEATEPRDIADHIDQLLDVFEAYCINFERAMSSIVALNERDPDVTRSLLKRLYKAGVGRRELLRLFLKLRQNDAALINALRHDPDAVEPEWLVKLLSYGTVKPNQFFIKLSIYFNETGGLARQIRQLLHDAVAQKPDVHLARPLATLVGENILTILGEQDRAGDEHIKLTAALRANMHHARPAQDPLALGWRKVGLKAVASRVMRCRPTQVAEMVHTLLEGRHKRTMRLALAMSQRSDCAAEIFSIAVTIRPLAALRAALPYYRNLGEDADLLIWDIVKSYILNVDLSTREGLRYILQKENWVPNAIKMEYSAISYLAFDKISDSFANQVIRNLMNSLPEVADDLLKPVLRRMIEKLERDEPESFPAFIIRYLMLCKSDNEEKSRFEEIGQPFLQKIVMYRKAEDKLSNAFFEVNLEQILNSLQYNFVFFDVNYRCCLSVIERVLIWMATFVPKEHHFQKYVKVHATMLYFKAIRQSIKQKPDIFSDPARKLSEGIGVVGFTFGRYIVKELAELKSKYFDSIVDLYHDAFTDYLAEYFTFGDSKVKFMTALTKGILSESVGNEACLAVHIIHEYPEIDEIKELAKDNKNKEVQMFAHAEIFF